jgi:hypothetical protein
MGEALYMGASVEAVVAVEVSILIAFEKERECNEALKYLWYYVLSTLCRDEGTGRIMISYGGFDGGRKELSKSANEAKEGF